MIQRYEVLGVEVFELARCRRARNERFAAIETKTTRWCIHLIIKGKNVALRLIETKAFILFGSAAPRENEHF